MNRFFMYVDPTEYEMTQEGLMKACLAEVIAEAKDTGDYPMYGEEMLLQSAKWKISLLYTSPSPRDYAASRMPSSA